MNSDDKAYGGDGLGTKTKVSSKKGEMHGFENYITMDLPGLSFILLKRKPKPAKKVKAKKAEDVVTEKITKDFTISPAKLQALCLEKIDKGLKEK